MYCSGHSTVRCGELLRPGRVVIAETYPAEYYGRVLGERSARWGKRHQKDRRAVAGAMLRFSDDIDIQCDPGLREAIENGFGSNSDGDDRFDAVVGLFAMLEVVTGRRAAGVPNDENVRKVEGWILGQN